MASMPKALHTALCLLLATAWLSHGSAIAAHGHAVVSVPTGSAAFDVSDGPRVPEHGSDEIAPPCAVCAQHASSGGPQVREASIDFEHPPERLAFGSERSDLAFETVLGDALSPRPPPLLAAHV